MMEHFDVHEKFSPLYFPFMENFTQSEQDNDYCATLLVMLCTKKSISRKPTIVDKYPPALVSRLHWSYIAVYILLPYWKHIVRMYDGI